MAIYRDRIPVTMPSSLTGPGTGVRRSSGAVAPRVLPVHEGIGLPSAGGFALRRETPGSAPEMRINVPGSGLHISDAVTTDFANNVPGTRTWSPPV